MSNTEIFICLAVMFFIGYLLGIKIERHRAMTIMDELHKELVDVIEKHKNRKEQMFQELDKVMAEHEYVPLMGEEPKEESDDN